MEVIIHTMGNVYEICMQSLVYKKMLLFFVH